MIESVLDNLPFYVAICLALYSFQAVVLSAALPHKLLNILILTNMSIAVSIGYVILRFVDGSLSESLFLSVVVQYLIFFFAAGFGTWIYRILGPVRLPTDTLRIEQFRFGEIDERRTFYTVVLMFLATIPYKLWVSYQLFFVYGSGDARLLIAREFRVLDTFFSAIDLFLPVFLVVIFLVSRRRFAKFWLLLYCALALFNGSKSSLIYIGILLIFMNFLNSKESPYSKRNLLLFGLSVFAYIGTSFLVKRDATGLDSLIRIVASAGIYDVAFFTGDYRQLIGFYDPVGYLLHPFLSVFGTRAYEYPLGGEILRTAGYVVGPTGPNPHLPVLSMVLFSDIGIAENVFAALAGLLAGIMMAWGVRVLKSQRNVLVRIAVFVCFYANSSQLFIDIGYFEIFLIKTVVVLVLLRLLLGRGVSRSAVRNGNQRGVL